MKRPPLQFTCPRCGWTHDDFVASGHFRCSACLAAALDLPSATVGLASLTAAVPMIDNSRGTPQRLLAELAIGLQLSIKDDDFELASVLRDTHHFLRSRLNRLH